MSEEKIFTETLENNEIETAPVQEEPVIQEVPAEEIRVEEKPAEKTAPLDFNQEFTNKMNSIYEEDKPEEPVELKPIPTFNMPVIEKDEEENKVKTFFKTAFSLSHLPIFLCAIAALFMVFAKLFYTIASSGGSQGVANAYYAFNFLGFGLVAASLIVFVINACIKKKIEFNATLFIVLVSVFAFC